MSGTPQIEFPCDYPIKVVGEYREDFRAHVTRIIRRHAPETPDASIRLRESRRGNYLSVSAVIRATGAVQLERLHADLPAYPAVRLVL